MLDMEILTMNARVTACSWQVVDRHCKSHYCQAYGWNVWLREINTSFFRPNRACVYFKWGKTLPFISRYEEIHADVFITILNNSFSCCCLYANCFCQPCFCMYCKQILHTCISRFVPRMLVHCAEQNSLEIHEALQV